MYTDVRYGLNYVHEKIWAATRSLQFLLNVTLSRDIDNGLPLFKILISELKEFETYILPT